MRRARRPAARATAARYDAMPPPAVGVARRLMLMLQPQTRRLRLHARNARRHAACARRAPARRSRCRLMPLYRGRDVISSPPARVTRRAPRRRQPPRDAPRKICRACRRVAPHTAGCRVERTMLPRCRADARLLRWYAATICCVTPRRAAISRQTMRRAPLMRRDTRQRYRTAPRRREPACDALIMPRVIAARAAADATRDATRRR